ncbi:MAG TPA: hypothetical protein VMU26_29375 [Candidatus Polarisedimenticolia bacterium]|nr:hypothetical protein [Candidatus Polarisedimenticolia bacterium]
MRRQKLVESYVEQYNDVRRDLSGPVAKADRKIREIVNADQKRKLDQLDQGPHPELHGNLNGATPPRPGAPRNLKRSPSPIGRRRALGVWKLGDVPSVPGIVLASLRIKVDWSSRG